jgi:hypothetical protein
MACVKKRGDGYRVDWRNKKGNRYRKTFTLKKEADDFLADIKVKMKSGTYVAPKVVPTLREVAEQWFANKKGRKLRPSTLSGYRSNLDGRILKADFADARLDTIQASDIETFRNQLAEKRTRTNSTFTAKTVNYILRDLGGIFAYAVNRQLASRNPVTGVERIKLDSEEYNEDDGSRADDEDSAEFAGNGDDADRAEIVVTEDEVLSPAECRKLIDAANDGVDRAFLMTAVMTAHGTMNYWL